MVFPSTTKATSMLQAYLKSPLLLSAAKHIPVSSLQIFIQYLESNCYATKTIQTYLNAVIHFSHWKHKQSLSCTEVTIIDKTSFVDMHLPSCQCSNTFASDKKTCAAALSHWFREVVQPNAARPLLSKNDKLVMAFDKYLMETAGLAPNTRVYRRRNVYEFLAWLDAEQSVPLDTLNIGHLSAFICLRAKQVSLASTAGIACSINSFLRFLSAQGHCQFNEGICVPRPKLLHCLPDKKSMSNNELYALLNSIDRGYPVGKRDYAITRCLSDLGIRTSEVVNLTVDDIDWRNNVITVNSSKSRRQHKLPIPGTLMEALIDYVKNGRPVTKTRQIFVYHRAPQGKPVKTTTVRAVVRRAFSRAGFNSTQSQVHRLRHTMATRLLMNKVTLKTIADILGHQSINTTIRYTYVDQAALRMIALPWPVRGQS
jgi:integrase/recombinase XerD